MSDGDGEGAGASTETSCGLGRWRPSCLRVLATPRVFLVVYGLLGTTQAMAFVYFVATLSTIEKRFKIPSKTTGIMLSGNEVSQILLSLVLTYYGGQRRRPLWIAWGVALSAASCFILASPHFVFGAGPEAKALTEQYLQYRHFNYTVSMNEQASLCSWMKVPPPNCRDDPANLELSSLPAGLVFLSQFVLGVGTTLYFTLGQTYLDDNTKKASTPMLLGLTMALRTVGPAFGFLLGFACLSLYIDPGLTPVITKKDPRWLGAWWLGWILLGTTMLMFSLLMAMFPKHLPKKKKEVSTGNNNEKQPSIPQLLQPQSEKLGKEELPLTTGKSFNVEPLPSSAKTENKAKSPTLKEFPGALARLLRNKLLVCNIWAGVFYILGGSAYITFITKYLEVQFQQSAAGASMITGPVSILAMMSGFLISGFLISKWKPRPVLLLSWNVVVGAVYVLSEIAFIFLGCPENALQGYRINNYGQLDLTMECNSNCGCQNIKYDPVCYEPLGLTFYSACHAGCTTSYVQKDIKIYDNCTCIRDVPIRRQGDLFSERSMWQGTGHGSGDISHHHQYYSVTGDRQSWSPRQQRQSSSFSPVWSSYNTPPWPYQPQHDLSVTAGPCQLDCKNTFLIFLLISTVMHTLGCSGKVGNLLVNYRSVLPEDKAFAQGLSLFMISLFAFIPGPIIFGAIIDSTCLVWDESCGRKGNCWLYNKQNFRFYLNITAACITTIGVVLDGFVCYLGRNLNLYEDEDDKQPLPTDNGEKVENSTPPQPPTTVTV